MELQASESGIVVQELEARVIGLQGELKQAREAAAGKVIMLQEEIQAAHSATAAAKQVFNTVLFPPSWGSVIVTANCYWKELRHTCEITEQAHHLVTHVYLTVLSGPRKSHRDREQAGVRVCASHEAGTGFTKGAQPSAQAARGLFL